MGKTTPSFFTKVNLSREDEESSEDSGPLCCCEYIDRNHERSHILFGCCYDDLDDDTYGRLICCSFDRRHQINMLLKFQDRFRIPWIGGAKQLPLDFIVPVLLIPTLLFLASLTALAAILTAIFTLVFLSYLYYQFRSSAYRTKFFFIWMICSAIYMEIIFQWKVPLLKILPSENFLFLFLIGMALFCFYKVRKLASRNFVTQGLSSEDDLEDIAEEERCTKVLIDDENGNKMNNQFYSEDEDDVDEDSSMEHTPEICRNCRKYGPPRSFHCILCKACIMRQDHHSLWLDCCIGASNHRVYIYGLILAATALLFGIYLTVTSICHVKLVWTIFGVNIILADDCSNVFEDFDTSLPYVSAAYALGISTFITLGAGGQIYLISNGITLAEWRKGRKGNTKSIFRNFEKFIFWLH